jgi:hypothetical protein
MGLATDQRPSATLSLEHIAKTYLLAAYGEPVFNLYAAFVSVIIKSLDKLLTGNQSDRSFDRRVKDNSH